MSLTRRIFPLKIRKLISAIVRSITRRKSSPRKYWPERWPERYQPEEYLPGHVWDALPGERYASVGDLCAHIGEQLPLQVVKLIARDLLFELEYLHETRGIAHNDIRPDAILLSPSDMKALISQLTADRQTQTSHPSGSSSRTHYLDFHTLLTSQDHSSTVFKLSNIDTDDQCNERFTERADRLALRSPEFILDAPCDTSVDLWSLGCVLYELLTGESLFDPFFQTSELGLSSEESHLIQMIELFGEFPEDLLQAGKNTNLWFNDAGALRLETTYFPVTLETILGMRMEEADVADAAAFLRTVLHLRPKDRSDAKDLLDHTWFAS